MAKRHIATSELCPLRNSEPEDVMHMAFKCQGAASMWSVLGITNYINDAMIEDRLGSQVLEALLKSSATYVPGYDSIKLQEMIAIGVWYI